MSYVNSQGRNVPLSGGQQIGAIAINTVKHADISGVVTINSLPYPPSGSSTFDELTLQKTGQADAMTLNVTNNTIGGVTAMNSDGTHALTIENTNNTASAEDNVNIASDNGAVVVEGHDGVAITSGSGNVVVEGLTINGTALSGVATINGVAYPPPGVSLGNFTFSGNTAHTPTTCELIGNFTGSTGGIVTRVESLAGQVLNIGTLDVYGATTGTGFLNIGRIGAGPSPCATTLSGNTLDIGATTLTTSAGTLSSSATTQTVTATNLTINGEVWPITKELVNPVTVTSGFWTFPGLGGLYMMITAVKSGGHWVYTFSGVMEFTYNRGADASTDDAFQITLASFWGPALIDRAAGTVSAMIDGNPGGTQIRGACYKGGGDSMVIDIQIVHPLSPVSRSGIICISGMVRT